MEETQTRLLSLNDVRASGGRRGGEWEGFGKVRLPKIAKYYSTPFLRLARNPLRHKEITD